MTTRLERTRSSMLWAAWADALGFISELTSAENLRRRTRGRPLTQPMAWSRIVGGRGGVRADLPEGCYSDDTQLRLATSRAISGHGFDVEAFSRVELTVWPSYALGGGRASKAAAAAMSRQQANWANNFYDGWENAGGNGAAMRIQPHVYAARTLSSFEHLGDVVRNSIVTHGHPRGIVGAVFHAVALTFALDRGVVPGPDEFGVVLEITHGAIEVFSRDHELAGYWVPQWERKTKLSFVASWHQTVDEVGELLHGSRGALSDMATAKKDRARAAYGYERLVVELGLAEPASRGSGTKTTVAALLLAAAFPEHPAQAAQVASARLDTDTDTIATMAAAIVGATSPRELISPVLDARYLMAEADRLDAIAAEELVPGFAYPDLLSWQPPRSALDATGVIDGALVLAGMSVLRTVARPLGNKDATWVWAETTFGQSMLVKHRHEPRPLRATNRPVQPPRAESSTTPTAAVDAVTKSHPDSGSRDQPTLFDPSDLDHPGSTVESALSWLGRNRYRDAEIGRAIRIVAASGTPEDAARLAREIAQQLSTND